MPLIPPHAAGIGGQGGVGVLVGGYVCVLLGWFRQTHQLHHKHTPAAPPPCFAYFLGSWGLSVCFVRWHRGGAATCLVGLGGGPPLGTRSAGWFSLITLPKEHIICKRQVVAFSSARS
jgi:hypothetical protein